jgi:hypothetical protein
VLVQIRAYVKAYIYLVTQQPAQTSSPHLEMHAFTLPLIQRPTFKRLVMRLRGTSVEESCSRPRQNAVLRLCLTNARMSLQTKTPAHPNYVPRRRRTCVALQICATPKQSARLQATVNSRPFAVEPQQKLQRHVAPALTATGMHVLSM